MKIILIPIGILEAGILTALKERLSFIFGCTVNAGSLLEIPQYAYEPDRAQYRASLIVDKLAESIDAKEKKILGVTGEDLFEQGLNFVFGEASPAHGAAVISLCRLRQEFNGELPDPDLLIDRAVKEAVHELGHTFGLVHCSNLHCVMHFSNCLADTDIKNSSFCSKCHPKLIK
jgi:archaemetzincin